MTRAAALGVLALLATACDAGAKDYQAAHARYLALVEAKRPLGSPEYAALLQDLDRVPRDSPSGPKAEALARRLRAVLAPMPPRPLARPAADGGADSCAPQAEALGRAAPQDRERLQAALAECRKAVLDDCGDHEQVPVAR